MRCGFHDKRPTVFLLGDSGIGNYRLDPGQRFQDFLEGMSPGTKVENWAEPGATPLDFLLQYSRGTLVSGKPQSVVAFSPDKFLDDDGGHRFDEGGLNLRWIPWNKTGWKLFVRLTPKERNVAIVQQASVPFYAVADLGKSLWIQYVQWPWERSQMRTANVERRKKIEAKSIECGKARDTLKIVDEKAYAKLPLAKDAEFLLTSLREQGIETRVILLPIGNPSLIQKTYSAHAQANHDTLKVRMRHWLDGLGQEYVDFNSPEEMVHFPDSTWDDMSHLKSPSAFSYISQRIHKSLASPSAHIMQQPLSAVSSDFPDDDMSVGD